MLQVWSAKSKEGFEYGVEGMLQVWGKRNVQGTLQVEGMLQV